MALVGGRTPAALRRHESGKRVVQAAHLPDPGRSRKSAPSTAVAGTPVAGAGHGPARAGEPRHVLADGPRSPTTSGIDASVTANRPCIRPSGRLGTSRPPAQATAVQHHVRSTVPRHSGFPMFHVKHGLIRPLDMTPSEDRPARRGRAVGSTAPRPLASSGPPNSVHTSAPSSRPLHPRAAGGRAHASTSSAAGAAGRRDALSSPTTVTRRVPPPAGTCSRQVQRSSAPTGDHESDSSATPFRSPTGMFHVEHGPANLAARGRKTEAPADRPMQRPASSPHMTKGPARRARPFVTSPAVELP